MKLSGVKYLADQGVENIWKNKMMAFATFCVLLISLLLVGMAGLFYVNVNSMIQGLGSQNEVVVLMQLGTTDEQNTAAQEAIAAIENVDTIDFISKEEALDRQRTNLPSAQRIFNDYIGDDASFMPDGFSVTVKNNDQIADTTAEIAAIDGVQSANASPQISEFLRELRRVVSLIAGAVIIALAVVSMIIISNTTKASVFARREEIQIMKYIGATDFFVRAPFVIEGMVIGFVGSLIPLAAVYVIYNQALLYVAQRFAYLSQLMQFLPVSEIYRTLLPVCLGLGAGIGFLGSFITVRKHLRV